MASRTFYRRLIPLVMIPRASVVERLVFRWTGFSLFNPIMTRASGFDPRPCLFLRTVHWKTGKTRDMVLPYLVDGGRFVVTGSLAGRPEPICPNESNGNKRVTLFFWTSKSFIWP